MEKWKLFLVRVFALPIIGNVPAYAYVLPGYFFLSLTTPLTFRLAGLRRMKCGTSVIWLPPDKKQALLNGLEFLRSCDPQMFSRLTEKQHLKIYYIGNSSKKVINALGYVFGLSERYFQFGDQGIAMFLVQSLLLSESDPFLNQFKGEHDRYLLRRVLEWMSQHSFRPGVINSYRKVVEKWEREREGQGLLF